MTRELFVQPFFLSSRPGTFKAAYIPGSLPMALEGEIRLAPRPLGVRALHHPLGLRLCGVCHQGWAAESVGGCFGNALDELMKEMNEELVV